MKPLPKGLIIGGLVLFVAAPLAGLLLTVIGMIQSFHDLGANGISDPRMLSAHIATVLYATMAGLITSGVGMTVAVIGAVIHFANRQSRPVAS